MTVHPSRNPIVSLNHRANVLRSGLYPGWVFIRIAVSIRSSPLPPRACLEDGAYGIDLAAELYFSRSGLRASTSQPGLLSFPKEKNVFQRRVFCGDAGVGTVKWSREPLMCRLKGCRDWSVCCSRDGVPWGASSLVPAPGFQ